MRRLLALIAIAFGLGAAIAYAQIINPGGGGGTPGGSNTQLQFNTASTFGGISGVTSDSANVGFATSSQLLLYGFTVGDCVKIGANNAIADFGAGCGGTGSPGGTNSQVQFNSNGNFAGISGATSDSLSIGFTTVTVNGNLTAGSAGFTGAVSGTTAQFQTHTGSVINLSGIASITASTIQLSGLLTGTSANFSALTVQGLSGCVQANGGLIVTTGVNCATQTSTPSIAAGSNITTSGTAANTTINVVATPSFTTVIATSNLTATTAQFTGWVTAPGIAMQTATIVGNLTGATANFSGNLTAGTAQLLGQLTGTSAVFQTVTVNNLTPTGPNCLQETGGVLQATNAACASPTSVSIAAGSNITTSGTATNVTVNVVATPSFTTVIASGNVTAGTAQITGLLTGTNAVFQTITVNNLTPTGPNCLQETGGVLQATNTACATQTATPSIAAGTNITTSGTAANTTVNVVATPSFTTVISTSNLTASTVLGVVGWLTAPGVNAQTETLAGNLTGTTGNFSSWLTGQFGTFPGFLTATGVSVNSITVANSLTSSTGNFTSILTASIYTGTPTGAGTLSFITPGVAQFATGGTAATNNGWMNWGGESRMSANPFLTITVGTLTPTGLSVNLAGGRTYSVEADLYIGTSVNTGGFQAALTGSYGSSNTTYFGYVVDGGAGTGASGTFEVIRGAALATAKNTVVASSNLSGPNSYVKITGTVTTSSPGTLVVQAAQNTANATHQLTITQGSRLLVNDMP